MSLTNLPRARLARKRVLSRLHCRLLLCALHPAFSVFQSFVCWGCFLRNQALSITIQRKALLSLEAGQPHFLRSLYSAANFPSLKLSLISISSSPVFLSRTECNPEPVFLTALFSCPFITKSSFPQKTIKIVYSTDFVPPFCGKQRKRRLCVCVLPGGRGIESVLLY